MHHNRPPHRSVRRLAAGTAALALVFAACNGDDGADDPFGAPDDTAVVDDTTTTTTPETTAPPTTDPDDTEVDEDDIDQPVSLELAVRSTLDAGNASYTIRLAQGTPDQLDDVDDADDADDGDDTTGTGTTGETGTGTTDDDGTDQTADRAERTEEIDGRVQFQQRVRSVTLDGDDDERQVIVDDETIYVELRGDELDDDDADWGRIDLSAMAQMAPGGMTEPGTTGGTQDDGTQDDDTTDTTGGAQDDGTMTAGAMMSLDLLIALHDPGSILAAVVPAQTGTVQDDAATGPQPGIDGRRAQVMVGVDQIEDPITQMMIRQLGQDELEVHVWIDETNGTDDDDVYVQQIAYALPTGQGMAPGTGTGTDDTDGTGTDGTGTDDTDTGTDGTGAGQMPASTQYFIVVEFGDIGEIDEIERPSADEVRDLDTTTLMGTTGAMTVNFLPVYIATLPPPGTGTGTGTDGIGTDGTGTGQDGVDTDPTTDDDDTD